MKHWIMKSQPKEKMETITLDISDDVFMKLAMQAHERDVTLNTHINDVIKGINKKEIKIQNITFFIGCAGWQKDQLMNEIEEGDWIVVAGQAGLKDQVALRQTESEDTPDLSMDSAPVQQ